ncbi:hypothetical protein CCAX7_002640 [Capsulimonas corticalis]|uniref:Uncharacterized protein n=1 Tax=Capsulimonas corticalis TaxID=2219043 RepID=A0A402CS16_9BACT|nr:hypothetical protein [Capsulimonas corticalis]BDI28213.1 hypothetical protein CCAX7_002640 [Capsulimonas corticalis]
MPLKKISVVIRQNWTYLFMLIGALIIAASSYTTGIAEAFSTQGHVAVPENTWNVSIRDPDVETHAFKIYNGQLSTLRLRLIPSCGCFTVFPSNITIPPLGRGTFTARVEPSKMTKDVSVLLTTPDSSRTSLPSLVRIVEIKFQR